MWQAQGTTRPLAITPLHHTMHVIGLTFAQMHVPSPTRLCWTLVYMIWMWMWCFSQGLSTEGYFKFKVQYKTGDKNAQLVLRLCSKTRWIAMLHVLPHTFEAALQQIRLQGFYYWVVKGATSLFNSFGAKSQNKLRVFVARFMLYLNFKVPFGRQAQGKAPHSYFYWLHLIEPQERTASELFIWMASVNFHPQTQK